MKRKFVICLIIFIGLGMSAPLKAQTYKWVDDQGVLHFSDQKPPQLQSEPQPMPNHQGANPKDAESEAQNQPAVQEIQSAGPTEVGELDADDSDADASDASDSYESAEVELYTTSWCGYCKKAKDYLNSKGVSFTEYDVEQDPEAAKRKAALGGGRGVPFAVINGKKIYGFSAETYESALAGK